jgi:hypothetical protein
LTIGGSVRWLESELRAWAEAGSRAIGDPQYRSIASRTGSTPWASLYYLTTEGRSEFANDLSDFYRFGGGQFGLYDQQRETYYKRLDEHVRKLAGDSGTVLSWPAEVFKGYKKLAAGSETVGRLAEYRSAYAKAKNELGYDDFNASLWAAFQARDLQDYAIAGTAIRSLNRYVIFLNAAIRGLTRTAQGIKENPKRFATKWLIYAALPEIFAYLWNWLAGDDDELAQLPAWQRDYFLNFKLGPDLWLRIPKPFELGAVASGFGRAIQYARGDEKAFEGWAGSVLKATTPVDEGAMLGPFKAFGEALANYDIFRDKPIVPPYENTLEIELRSGTENASRIGQLIQEAIGVDARKIDHIIKSQLGGVGELAMDVSDTGRADQPGLTKAAKDAIGLLKGAPASTARDVQFVLDWAQRKGQQNKPAFKSLRNLIQQYHKATSAGERDRLATQLRTVATEMRATIESEDQ